MQSSIKSSPYVVPGGGDVSCDRVSPRMLCFHTSGPSTRVTASITCVSARTRYLQVICPSITPHFLMQTPSRFPLTGPAAVHASRNCASLPADSSFYTAAHHALQHCAPDTEQTLQARQLTASSTGSTR